MPSKGVIDEVELVLSTLSVSIVVTGRHRSHNYLDIRGKIGKAAIKPLRQEGYDVIAINANIDELGEKEVRIWFGSR